MLKRGLLILAGLAVLAAVSAIPARAQFGSLEGDITDPDGKPATKDSGYSIIIERLDIKGTYKLQPKDIKRGHYFHGGLPLGKYTVNLIGPDGKPLDQAKNVQVRLGDNPPINFNLKANRERAMAQQAGIKVRPDQGGGSGAPQLSKEDRAKIQEQLKQREAMAAKIAKLQKSYGTGMEAMKTANDQTLLAAALNLPADTTLTPEVHAQLDAKKAELCGKAATDFAEAAESAKGDANEHIVLAQLAEADVCSAKLKKGEEAQALYAKAIDAYKRAIELKADDPSYHNNFALALVNAGKMPEALEELNKAAQLDPAGAGRYYYNLGAVLTNSGRGKEATEAFKRAVEADPKYADAWYQLGVSLLADVKLDTATGKSTPAPGTLEALNKYLELQPDGSHAAEAKSMIDALGGTIQTLIKSEKATKKAPASKKKQ